ncbi:MAG TPA: phosphoglucosamine mutase [bacterium]|nr:phosphoglucosamine mutase [bacterium]
MTEKKLFGTDGIRGKANVYPLLPETAVIIGKAITRYFSGNTGSQMNAAIGMDPRISSSMLVNAVSAGIMSAGGNVTVLGVVPTPLVSDYVRNNRCDFGIVISASHNPYHDNGIKIFNSKGEKLNDEEELEIEKLFFEGPASGVSIGKHIVKTDSYADYANRISAVFSKNLSGCSFKICVDCANGAASFVAQQIFKNIEGIQSYFFSKDPDGYNINDNCGALHPEIMSKTVVEKQCDIGITYDGDADRLITIDELGNIVDGDKLIGIFARYLKNNGMLKNNTVVTTVMSNAGLEKFLKDEGIKLLRTNVGDRYVFEKIKETGSSLGGENSGHIILSDINPTGDGILASLMILAVMNSTKKKLSELAADIELFPQFMTKVKVSEKKPLESVEGLVELIEKEESGLDGGRMLIRYSGTEPVLRVMAEGPDMDKVKKSVENIAEFVKRQL